MLPLEAERLRLEDVVRLLYFRVIEVRSMHSRKTIHIEVHSFIHDKLFTIHKALGLNKQWMYFSWGP